MEGQITLGKRVFMIFGETAERPIGTGFNLERLSLVLTAHHVLQDQRRVYVVNTSGPELLTTPSYHIVRHPVADVAAIILPKDTWKDAECFVLGVPPTDYSDFPLGEDVLSYGYPQMGLEKPVPPRLMKGHIQRQFRYMDGRYDYLARELGFPAFHGQSGSPVFLDNARNNVVGVVTRSISFRSESEGEISNASWAIGVSLAPLAIWIKSISQRLT